MLTNFLIMYLERTWILFFTTIIYIFTKAILFVPKVVFIFTTITLIYTLMVLTITYILGQSTMILLFYHSLLRQTRLKLQIFMCRLFYPLIGVDYYKFLFLILGISKKVFRRFSYLLINLKGYNFLITKLF